MSVFIIGYDLNKQDKDYEGVFQAIKDSSDGNWCHYLDSTWLIKSSLTPDKIQQNIKPHIDDNDRLLIIEVINNIQGWLTNKQWEYINNNIFG